MAPYSNTIKDWPEGERPRERLVKYGPESLSEAQLLAILLRTGSRRQTAFSLALELLDKYKNVRGLSTVPLETLCKIKGVGIAKACQIKAALELGKRLIQHKYQLEDRVHCAEEVYQYLRLRLRDLTREEFSVLFLTARHDIINMQTIYKGTLTESLVSPRDIVFSALQYAAAAIILAHNHPSGDPSPSPEDKKVTQKIVRACNYFDLKVLDHIIVSRDSYFSFAEQGLLD